MFGVITQTPTNNVDPSLPPPPGGWYGVTLSDGTPMKLQRNSITAVLENKNDLSSCPSGTIGDIVTPGSLKNEKENDLFPSETISDIVAPGSLTNENDPVPRETISGIVAGSLLPEETDDNGEEETFNSLSVVLGKNRNYLGNINEGPKMSDEGQKMSDEGPKTSDEGPMAVLGICDDLSPCEAAAGCLLKETDPLVVVSLQPNATEERVNVLLKVTGSVVVSDEAAADC
jgi:hypothetical protein